MARLVLMLCGLAAMLQASGFDSVSFDPLSFQQDCLTASKVDVGWRQVGDVLVVSQMVIVTLTHHFFVSLGGTAENITLAAPRRASTSILKQVLLLRRRSTGSFLCDSHRAAERGGCAGVQVGPSVMAAHCTTRVQVGHLGSGPPYW